MLTQAQSVGLAMMIGVAAALFRNHGHETTGGVLLYVCGVFLGAGLFPYIIRGHEALTRPLDTRPETDGNGPMV